MLIEQRKQLELLFAFHKLFTEYNDDRQHQITNVLISLKYITKSEKYIHYRYVMQ